MTSIKNKTNGDNIDNEQQRTKRPFLKMLLILVIGVCIIALMIFSIVVSMPPGQVITKLFFSTPFLKLDPVISTPTLSVDTVVADMLTGTSLFQDFASQTPSPAANKFSTQMPEIAGIITETLHLDPIETTEEKPSEVLCSPINGVEIEELGSIISQRYDVKNPYTDFGHHGVDFGSYDFHGTYLYDLPIQAIFSGKIIGVVDNRPPLGNVLILETDYSQLPGWVRELIEIQPGESLYHLYAHLLVSPTFMLGTHVLCGEEINRLGDSQTIEAHLHLELRVGKSGQTFGSMTFYDTGATEEEMNEYLRWRTSGDFMPLDPMEIFLKADSK